MPNYPPQPAPHTHSWPLVSLAITTIAGVALGVAALIVALTIPASGGSAATPTTAAAPTYTAAETAAAHQKLCDTYKLAARSVQIETNRGTQALAGVALANGALLLRQAVDAAPALTSSERAAAIALADAYTNVNAVGSIAVRDDPVSQAALDDANAKSTQMKAICGGG
ncbi:hypothetical protein PR371_20670 [Mycobacterium marinum]|nr:hypothetical protein [Mycobacterium marinum]MDC8996379.1 hypothetical protein [Mycobacterium marinum]WDZ16621.1 hypothetical protein PQR73_014955 [Mycobacterium marinum]